MKILILGYSDLAIRRIIPAFTKIKNIKFDIASKSKKERKTGHEKWFRDYNKGIELSNANIVYISLVNALHYKYALKALKKNKNVIIDKPFSLNLKQSYKLLNLAKKKRLLISQALVFSYHKQFDMVKKLVKDNKINLDRIIMKFCIPKPKNNNFKLSKKMGGGCFNDMMPYAASINRYFLKSKLVYKKLIMKNNNNLNESFSINTSTKKTEFYGLFSHNSEYCNTITFLAKFYSITLYRFSAPPAGEKLVVEYKKKNKLKKFLIEKDDTFKNFFYEFFKVLKKKNITYYHKQIKEDSKFTETLYNTKTIL